MSKFNPKYKHVEINSRSVQKYTIADPHKNIFKTRQTGRFGNQMFEYMFWYLMAMQHGGIFKNTYSKPFPAPFDNLPSVVEFGTPVDIGLSNYKERIPGYPMNIKYYANHRDLLIRRLKIPQFKIKYDLVVHVRLDDVFGDHPDYTVLPLSFYRDCFASIKKSYDTTKFKILLIGRPINDFQKKIFMDIRNCVSKLSGSKKVITQTGTMTEDLVSIMQSPILIASTSSFWFWPSFLSLNSKRVYIPIFGQTNMYYYFASDTKFYKKYAVRSIDNYKIYGYLMAIKEKIYKDEIHKMYD